MSQNKLTTFIHNNLIAIIIAALVVGGLSALSFSAYNSGVKSVQSNLTATTELPQSSSSTIKSSLVSSSIASSLVISSSSSEESKKEAVNETPKTINVYNLIENNKDKYFENAIFYFSPIDGGFYDSEDYAPKPTNSRGVYTDFNANRYETSVQNSTGDSEIKLTIYKYKVSGRAKYLAPLSKISKFSAYIFDENVIIEPIFEKNEIKEIKNFEMFYSPYRAAFFTDDNYFKQTGICAQGSNSYKLFDNKNVNPEWKNYSKFIVSGNAYLVQDSCGGFKDYMFDKNTIIEPIENSLQNEPILGDISN